MPLPDHPLFHNQDVRTHLWVDPFQREAERTLYADQRLIKTALTSTEHQHLLTL